MVNHFEINEALQLFPLAREFGQTMQTERAQSIDG
jgi:hypothetical protein